MRKFRYHRYAILTRERQFSCDSLRSSQETEEAGEKVSETKRRKERDVLDDDIFKSHPGV